MARFKRVALIVCLTAAALFWGDVASYAAGGFVARPSLVTRSAAVAAGYSDCGSTTGNCIIFSFTATGTDYSNWYSYTAGNTPQTNSIAGNYCSGSFIQNMTQKYSVDPNQNCGNLFAVYSSGGASYTGPDDVATLSTGPPPTPYCTQSTFTDAAAGLVGGTLSVRWHFRTSGVLPPTWSVYAGSSHASAGLVGTLSRPADAVEGSPGYIAGNFTGVTGSPTVVFVSAPMVGTAPGCSTADLTPRSTGVAPGGSSYGAISRGGGGVAAGEDCGFNPVCYLASLFVPSDGTIGSWSTLVASAQARPPISIAVGGVTFLRTAFDAIGQGSGCASVGHASCHYGFQVMGSSTYAFDPLTKAGDFMQGAGSGLFVLLQAAIWVTGLFYVWHMVGRSFGARA